MFPLGIEIKDVFNASVEEWYDGLYISKAGRRGSPALWTLGRP